MEPPSQAALPDGAERHRFVAMNGKARRRHVVVRLPGRQDSVTVGGGLAGKGDVGSDASGEIVLPGWLRQQSMTPVRFTRLTVSSAIVSESFKPFRASYPFMP